MDDSLIFAIDTHCRSFRGIYRERLVNDSVSFPLCSSWRSARDRRSQLVTVVANLDGIINFSYKPRCHFFIPWLEWDPQEPSCESSPKTVTDSMMRPSCYVRVRCRGVSPRVTHASGCWVCIRETGYRVQQERPQSRWKWTLESWSHFNQIVLSLTYLRNWTSGHVCLQFNHPYPQGFSHGKCICMNLYLSSWWCHFYFLYPGLIYCQEWKFCKFIFLILSHTHLSSWPDSFSL